jgi:hypothetical protein
MIDPANQTKIFSTVSNKSFNLLQEPKPERLKNKETNKKL